MKTRLHFMAFVFLAILPADGLSGEAPQQSFPDVLFSGNLRLRYEHKDNFNIKRYGIDSSDDFLLTRLRLNADLLLREDFHAFAQLQDSRIFFGDLNRHDFDRKCPHENRIDLRQAYIEHKSLGGGPFGLKLGRQAISYGDNRIWGPGNWGNAGRYTWDAAKLYYYTDFVHLDAIAGEHIFYDATKFDGYHYDYQVYGLYAQLPRTKAANFDLFYVLKRDHHDHTAGESGISDLKRHTVGTYVKGKFGETDAGTFDYNGTAAYQFGDHGKDTVKAYAAVGEMGYTFKRRFTPRLYAACSYASGDSDPDDGDNGTFDGVNGAVDKLYGRINFFSFKNLIDYQCGLSINPSKKSKLSVDYHLFQLARSKDAWYWSNCKNQLRDNTGASGRSLGQEVDFIAKWQVPLSPSMKKTIKKLELLAGYSYFIPGRFVENKGSGGDANWAFLQMALFF